MNDPRQPDSQHPLARPRYLTVAPPGGWAQYMKHEPPVQSPFHMEFDRDKILLSGRRSALSHVELVRFIQARGLFYVDLEGTSR